MTKSAPTEVGAVPFCDARQGGTKFSCAQQR
jgi:hypothetical protein